jgi:hypothetical protein
MPHHKRSRKTIAATLLVIFFTNTFAPSISYALTSGPTQPEATSFEPIDTTDMVNLQTGDFTYNIPLIEIPGPEGNYPLSLSYHAGIQVNEDASWVGLGWTLNPGAINRSVNGYPDDWNGPTTSNHAYWVGGTTTTYSVGFSVGVANCATVGAGLSFSSDTYRGFGVGFDESVSLGFKISDNMRWGVNFGVGVTPYGDGYIFGGAGLGFGNSLRANIGVNFSTNFETTSVGFSGGVSYNVQGTGSHANQTKSFSLLGASIGTGGGKPSLTVGGLTASVNNSKAGNISTSSHGFHIEIPIWWGVNFSFGYNKTRYWTNETVGVATYGSLNFNNYSGSSGSDVIANDQYALLEDPAYRNIIDYGNPTTVQGGSYFDYDVYSVNAQGLGGNMRPYIFQGGLRNQNVKLGSTTYVDYNSPGIYSWPASFRFENDFSNSYRQNYPTFSDPSFLWGTPPFDTSPVHGNNDGSTGFSSGNGLAGSKHVDVGVKIQPRNPLGYTGPATTVNGFSITNESGVTYHFGLPAYTYNEENYQEKIDPGQTQASTGNRISKPAKYPYTWYLTTITGPDYVDRNNNHVADADDWGYWVDFEYGKWNSSYNWRNPSEGFRRDEDNGWRDCSMGTREVYYLNAVRTRSHVAYFEKDVRNDAKGASPEIFNKTTVGNITSAGYANEGLYNVNSSQSLKLTHIYLLNAADSGIVTPGLGPTGQYTPARGILCPDCELPGNVLDASDVTPIGRGALEAKAIKIIDFNYDYSLCAGTTNSFNFTAPEVKSGKLTLLNVISRGKGGANLMPPAYFNYEPTGTDLVSQGVTLTPTNFTTTNGNFKKGDMIWSALNVYCGVITDKSLSGSTYTYTLANSQYTGGSTTSTVSTSKNPPYNKDAYDTWGMYKSDYNSTLIDQNESLYRQTSVLSSAGVDAWSLRSVTSQLGSQIKIGYESDQYSSVVMNNSLPFITATLAAEGSATSNTVPYSEFKWDSHIYATNNNTGYNNIVFTVNTSGGVFWGDYFTAGGKGKIVLGCRYQVPSSGMGTIEAIQADYTITSIDPLGTIRATLSNPIPASYHARTSVLNLGDFSLIGLVTANVSPTVSSLSNAYGGGLRVNKVSVADNSGTLLSTVYNYNDPANPTNSSGSTPYTPSGLDVSGYVINPNVAGDDLSFAAYRRALFAKANSLYSIAREIPPPGIMYRYVTVTNQVKNSDEASTRNIEGSTQYQFEVFRDNMVGISDITPRTGPVSNPTLGPQFSRNLVLQKFIGSIGNLKSTVRFDANGNKLSEAINNYLHDGLENMPLSQFMTTYKARLTDYKYRGQQLNYAYQGFLQERTFEVKTVQNQTNPEDNGVKATLSARESYPCIQVGQTLINYVNGTQAYSTNLGFDYYSGAVTQTLEVDPYGNNFVTQTVPAYTKYFGDASNVGMGLKVNYDHNLNMLTQIAETYRWKVDPANYQSHLGLVSASANVWSNQMTVYDANGSAYVQNNELTNGSVWRLQSTYDWMPSNATVTSTDGLTPTASFVDFNWTTPASSNTNWKNTSNITRYDVYSKALESTDINGNYAATRMEYGDKRIAFSGGPAKFYEIAYSGAEDAGINQTGDLFVKAGDGVVSTAAGSMHTGVKSLRLDPSGKKGFIYSVPTNKLIAGRNYQASVWVKPLSGTNPVASLRYDINGTVKTTASGSSQKMANGWYLINLPINGSDIVAGNTLNVYCINNDASLQAYIDDFRFQPVNAATTAYVYDPFSGELTYVLDNSNLYTQYVYDDIGKLMAVYKEKLGTGVFKTNDYQYNYSATKFLSLPINTSYQKNNCGSGYIGSWVPVNLPAGTGISFQSSQDADARAGLKAQKIANDQGSCIAAGSVLVSVPFGAVSTVKFLQGSTEVVSATIAYSNQTLLVPYGTYTVTVTQVNGQSHTVSVPGYTSQTGVTVTFNNVAIPAVTSITIN